jgi:hypothetical protein
MENLATISFSAVLVVDSGAAPKSVQLVSFHCCTHAGNYKSNPATILVFCL